jgi:hypothetical protein
MAFSVGNKAVAIIDLTAPDGADFSISHASLLESAVGVLKTWFAGVLDGAAAQALEVEPTESFESVSATSSRRRKKGPAETGVIVIDLAPGAQRRETRVRSNVPSPVARQLRASDVLGRLKTGQICAVLTGTWRRRHQLRGLRGCFKAWRRSPRNTTCRPSAWERRRSRKWMNQWPTSWPGPGRRQAPHRRRAGRVSRCRKDDL